MQDKGKDFLPGLSFPVSCVTQGRPGVAMGFKSLQPLRLLQPSPRDVWGAGCSPFLGVWEGETPVVGTGELRVLRMHPSHPPGWLRFPASRCSGSYDLPSPLTAGRSQCRNVGGGEGHGPPWSRRHVICQA